MPFTTTATWPALANRTASAADVNNKFAWLEGHRYPHSSGGLTTGAYDVGSSAYIWNSGIFNNVILGGVTLGADVPGRTLDAWVGTILGFTTTSGFNISAITTYFGVGGTHGGYAFTFISPMADNLYSVIATSTNRVYLMSLTTTYCRTVARDSTGYPVAGSFYSIMVKE